MVIKYLISLFLLNTTTFITTNDSFYYLYFIGYLTFVVLNNSIIFFVDKIKIIK